VDRPPYPPGDLVVQDPQCLQGGLLDRVAHGGQGGLDHGGRRGVVEPDHGHVAWHPPPGLPQRPHRAHRHQVRGDEQPPQAWVAGEQLLSAMMAAAQRPVAGSDQIRMELVPEGAPIAIKPLAAAAGVQRPGHGPDRAVNPGGQVAHHGEGRLLVVDRHPGERVLEAERLAQHHERQPLRQQPSEQRLLLVSQREQGAVHVAQRQVVAEEVLLLLVLRGRYQQVAAGLTQLAGEDPGEQPEVGVLEQALLPVGDDEGDRAGAAAGEVSRRLVDRVAEGINRRVHRVEHGGAHVAAAIDHPGHCAARYAGQAGDVLDCRAPACLECAALT
jgi:hypothetical protein